MVVYSIFDWQNYSIVQFSSLGQMTYFYALNIHVDSKDTTSMHYIDHKIQLRNGYSKLLIIS
jgi:hypothetical protein